MAYFNLVLYMNETAVSSEARIKVVNVRRLFRQFASKMLILHLSKSFTFYDIFCLFSMFDVILRFAFYFNKIGYRYNLFSPIKNIFF